MKKNERIFPFQQFDVHSRPLNAERLGVISAMQKGFLTRGGIQKGLLKVYELIQKRFDDKGVVQKCLLT